MDTKKENFYRYFFRIYVALVLQNVVTLSVNLTDNIMLGAYSETALAGVTAVNQIQFIYQQLLMALGDGLVMFCSQYWGKKEIAPIRRIASLALRIALGLAVALFVAVSIWPREMLSFFTTDQPIIEQGAGYLKIVRFTYVFFAVTQLMLASLRSVETVKIAFYMSIMTFFINCGINYALIFGNLGAPALGAQGAAIGTLCARVVECAVILWFVFRRDRKLCLRPGDLGGSGRGLWKPYIRQTAPLALLSGLWGLNTALQTAILGHMTPAAIAANSDASTLYLLVKSTAVGASSTAAVIIGKAIGAGDIDLVKSYSKRMQRLFLMIGICSGVLLFFLRIPVLSLYDLRPETREMADHFLMILSVVCMGMSYQMPTNGGIIRGGGSSMFVVKEDLISIWGIVVPLSLIMAFVVKASPEVVVICLNADQVFKCLPAYLKANHGNWIKKLA